MFFAKAPASKIQISKKQRQRKFHPEGKEFTTESAKHKEENGKVNRWRLSPLSGAGWSIFTCALYAHCGNLLEY